MSILDNPVSNLVAAGGPRSVSEMVMALQLMGGTGNVQCSGSPVNTRFVVSKQWVLPTAKARLMN